MPGLKVRVDPRRQNRVVHARYQPSEFVEVSFPLSLETWSSFVRSQSVHFDLDPDGYSANIEVMGPPRHTWRVSELHWPQEIEEGDVRFLQPEQCEEDETEQFETNLERNVLRIVFTSRTPNRYVAPAASLVFGIDEMGELVELWIGNLEA